MSAPVAVAFPDLMDRSRFEGRMVAHVSDLDRLPEGTTMLLVDLRRHPLDAAASRAQDGVRVVGVVPHVDHPLRTAAEAEGLEVVARSWCFSHLDELVGPVSGPGPAQEPGMPKDQPPSV